VQRTRDGRTGQILGGRAIEKSGGIMCCLHCARGDESTCFLVEPQNPGRRFVSGLTSKPVGRFLIGLGLKTDGDGFHRFSLKPVVTVSGGLASKPPATVSSRFGLKTGGDSF
jgi:hypothetical protein